MSMSQTEMNPNWAQPEKQRRGCGGMSCLMIGCGGLLLLCCGLGTWVFFYVGSMFTDDPAEIAAARQSIAQIDVPDDLEPVQAMNLKFPFMGDIATGVVFVDPSASSSLVLIGIDRSLAEEQEQDIREAIEESLRQQGAQQQEDFQVTESHERQFTMRGQEVTFFFKKGKSSETGKALIQVEGTFEGDSGPAILIFLGDPEKYDEEAIAEMIESIQ